MFVVLTRRASVFLPLKAIFTPVCLNRLVTFLMLNMAHFSFFLGCAGSVGERGLCSFLCHAVSLVVDQGGGEVIAGGYMRDSLPFILTFVPVGGWINN